MRVLVTRPKPAAIATARRLESAGHEAILLPLMEARHDPYAAQAALSSPHDAIALTSAEAVRALAALALQQALPLSVPLYCVGRATADAARALGFKTVATGNGDGEGLARLIGAENLGPPGLLYLAGHPRAQTFEASLTALAVPFRTAEIYRMTPLDYPPGHVPTLLAKSRPDAILFYSTETARRFFALLGDGWEALAKTRILCLSDAIAKALPADVRHVSIAERPDEDSLLRRL